MSASTLRFVPILASLGLGAAACGDSSPTELAQPPVAPPEAGTDAQGGSSGAPFDAPADGPAADASAGDGSGGDAAQDGAAPDASLDSPADAQSDALGDTAADAPPADSPPADAPADGPACNPDPQTPANGPRTVLVAHPFGPTGSTCGRLVRVMRLDAAGSLAPTGTSIDTGDCPERVAFAPDGRLALVLHSNSHDPMAGTQTVVALANDAAGAVKIVAELKELSKTNPHDVAFSGDGRKAYVSDFDIEGKGGVHVLDVAPGCGVSYSKKIPLAVPTALQVLPGDAHAIVIGGKDPLDVAVLDLTAGTVAAQYDLFSDFVDAQSIGLSPDAKRLLVPNASPFSSLADQVTVLSLTTAGGVPVPAVQMVMANVPEPSGVAYSPDGTKALVTNFSKNRATWLDVAAGGSISLGGTVTGIPLADRVSTLRRGPNAGLVLVTAVTDIHLLQFGASSVTSKGKVSLGSGNGAIAGDVAVEP